jgi:hypothetical protein
MVRRCYQQGQKALMSKLRGVDIDLSKTEFYLMDCDFFDIPGY